MDKYESTPLLNAPELPLIDYSGNHKEQPKRQSYMVAFARVFMVVAPVLLLVGLYWRLA